MNLTPEQQKTLREETARGFSRSAALHRERTALLQQLDARMVSDDGHSTERVTKVRAAMPLSFIANSHGAFRMPCPASALPATICSVRWSVLSRRACNDPRARCLTT